uniref:Uncharacterized protein n=1 Tax=viral metagenome TaxID=1070528 RepID=A0A6C0KMQ8_9ZZZZ
MLKHIRIAPLVLGLVMGIVGILFVNPEKNIIYKYPTPENAEKVVYKDKNGVCYTYKANKVDCDKNESRLKNFPLTK